MIIYRIEHKDTGDGMWYNYDGSYNGVVKELTDGKSKNAPMELTELQRAEGKKWHSGVKSLEQLYSWFSQQDIDELSERGYRLFKLTVTEYIDCGNEMLFTRAGVEKQELVG